MQNPAHIFLAFGACWVAAGLSSGEVVFSTYTDPPGPNTGVYYRVASDTTHRLGWGFTPSASGDISSVLATMTVAMGVRQPVTLEVYRDTGSIPGSLVGTLSGTPARSFEFVQTEYTPSSAIPIDAGALYYLVLVSPSTGAIDWAARELNFPGITQIYQSNDGQWSTGTLVPALFSVSIPAPATGGVLPMLVLLARRRRR